MFTDHRNDLLCLRQIREFIQQAQQQPVAVNAGVPVIAAVENRMQLPRRLSVGGGGGWTAWGAAVMGLGAGAEDMDFGPWNELYTCKN